MKKIIIFNILITLITMTAMIEKVEADNSTYENYFRLSEFDKEGKSSFTDNPNLTTDDNNYIEYFDELLGNKYREKLVSYQAKIAEEDLFTESFIPRTEIDGKIIKDKNDDLVVGDFYQSFEEQSVYELVTADLHKIKVEPLNEELLLYNEADGLEKKKDSYGNEYIIKNGVVYALLSGDGIVVQQKYIPHIWKETNNFEYFRDLPEEFLDGEFKYVDSGNLGFKYDVEETSYALIPGSSSGETLYISSDVGFEKELLEIKQEIKPGVFEAKKYLKLILYGQDKDSVYLLEEGKMVLEKNKKTIKPGENFQVRFNSSPPFEIEVNEYYKINFDRAFISIPETSKVIKTEEKITEKEYGDGELLRIEGEGDFLKEERVVFSDKSPIIYNRYTENELVIGKEIEHNLLRNFLEFDLKHYGERQYDQNSNFKGYKEIDDFSDLSFFGYEVGQNIYQTIKNKEGESQDILKATIVFKKEENITYQNQTKGVLNKEEQKIFGKENIAILIDSEIINEENKRFGDDFFIEIKNVEGDLEEGLTTVNIFSEGKLKKESVQIDENSKVLKQKIYQLSGNSYEKISEEYVSTVISPIRTPKRNEEVSFEDGKRVVKVTEYEIEERNMLIYQYKTYERVYSKDEFGDYTSTIIKETKGVNKELKIGDQVKKDGEDYIISSEDIKGTEYESLIYVYDRSVKTEVNWLENNKVFVALLIATGTLMLGMVFSFIFKKGGDYV